MLKVGVVGCTGKLGREITKYVLKTEMLSLNAAITRKGNGFVGKVFQF